MPRRRATAAASTERRLDNWVKPLTTSSPLTVLTSQRSAFGPRTASNCAHAPVATDRRPGSPPPGPSPLRIPSAPPLHLLHRGQASLEYPQRTRHNASIAPRLVDRLRLPHPAWSWTLNHNPSRLRRPHHPLATAVLTSRYPQPVPGVGVSGDFDMHRADLGQHRPSRCGSCRDCGLPERVCRNPDGPTSPPPGPSPTPAW